MARKAGPGDGAEDAPEGRADLSPTEGGFLPDARLPDDPLAPGSSDPAGEARPEPLPGALSDEGIGLRPSPDAVGEVEPLGTPMPPEEPAEDGGLALSSARGSGLGLGSPGPEDAERDAVAGDPWRPGPPSDPERTEPLVLTTAVPPAEDAGGAPEPPPALARSEPPVPPLAPPPPRRRGGFGALLLGGMIAAALGFGAAWLAQERFGLLPARLPAGVEDRLAALEARPVPDEGADEGAVEALTGRLAELETRLTALEEAPAPTAAEPAPAFDPAPLREEIAQAASEAQARVAELEERLADLEARPAAPTGDAAALGSLAPDAGPAVRAAPPMDPEALREEVLASLDPRLSETEAGLEEVRAALSEARSVLDDLSARLDRAEAQSSAAAEEARAAAESLAAAETRAANAESEARARAALGQVEAALQAGEPFEAPLGELGAAGVAVPEDLAALAAEGVPTLADLRDSFPEAARAALAAARDQGVLDDGSGVLGFLRGQLSVRSVAPREGGDPDAVLSRAESQLETGQLDAALAEIGTLPEPVRAAMADWIAQAETRAQADAALAGLRDALPAPDVPPAD